MTYPKIPSYALPLITAVVVSVLYINKHFAHASDLERSEITHTTNLKLVQVRSQVNDWSIEQSLIYIQQSQIKNELRREKRRKNPDNTEIEELKETGRVLKMRSIKLQELQDQIVLDSLKAPRNP